MHYVAEWRGYVYLFEQDDVTHARVSLDTGNDVLTGEGMARRRPSDPSVPEIGDELAVGRAFIDVGEQLVRAADDDVTALASKRHVPVP